MSLIGNGVEGTMTITWTVTALAVLAGFRRITWLTGACWQSGTDAYSAGLSQPRIRHTVPGRAINLAFL
ncbi:hypothetical protein [Aidingimonas halophila]|uniref:hypothetical protein n=1 Tax=Aidingimonas halophila TaxID=574349 RepID=UPI000B8480B3|nr:hypothetical protein [Aidingimonas halophila]